jgi:hypothetical protein
VKQSTTRSQNFTIIHLGLIVRRKWIAAFAGQLPSIKPGGPYFSIDNKLCQWGPILRSDLTHSQVATSLETLESDGPFEPSFLANMVVVYNILHACWGKSNWWSHVKKFSKTKNW